MTTRATTTAAERIDLLLEQARRFYGLDLVGEAIARMRHVLSQVDRELRATNDPETRHDIETRRAYAIHMLERLGGKPFPSAQQHGTI